MADAETEFRECPSCAAKPGAPDLCAECLERRALIVEVRRLRALLWPTMSPQEEQEAIKYADNVEERCGIEDKEGLFCCRRRGHIGAHLISNGAWAKPSTGWRDRADGW